jgi:hypothetical protein
VAAVLGIAATAASFVVVRGDVDRINQRIDRPGNDALLRLQDLVIGRPGARDGRRRRRGRWPRSEPVP